MAPSALFMGLNGSEWVLTLFDSFYNREHTAWLSSGPSNPNSKPGRHPAKFLGSLDAYSGTLPTGFSPILPLRESSQSQSSRLPPCRSSTLSVYLKDPLSRTSRIDSFLETSLCDTYDLTDHFHQDSCQLSVVLFPCLTAVPYHHTYLPRVSAVFTIGSTTTAY